MDSYALLVEDSDGDTEGGTLTVNINDDTPSATISATGTTVTVDESAGLQDDDVAGPLAVFRNNFV